VLGDVLAGVLEGVQVGVLAGPRLLGLWSCAARSTAG